MIYDIQANLSKIEWEIIKEIRKLTYGSLELTYVNGSCVGLKRSETRASEELKKLQAQTL